MSASYSTAQSVVIVQTYCVWNYSGFEGLSAVATGKILDLTLSLCVCVCWGWVGGWCVYVCVCVCVCL